MPAREFEKALHEMSRNVCDFFFRQRGGGLMAMQTTGSGFRTLAMAGLLLSLLAGCSSLGSPEPGAAPSTDGGGGSFFDSLFGKASSPNASQAGAATGAVYTAADPTLPCPRVEINPGTGAYRVFEPGKQNDNLALRYQATVVKMARECGGLGAEMAIRVGIAGRVVVGAKGGPGRVNVPLRIAVLDGQNQPVYSQLRTVAVDVLPGANDAEFTHVEEGILVPVDETRLRGWRVFVGFDDSTAPARKS
jgi:hypothetical protein